MSKEQTLAREARWGRTVGVLGLLGIVIFILAGLLNLAPDFNAAEEIDGQLEAFPDERGGMLVQLVLQAIAVALFVAPLVFLFRAAAARSDRVRRGLIGLAVAGPVFFAVSFIASWFALDAAADVFADATIPADTEPEDFAEDLIGEQTATDITSGLRFAGLIGLVFIVVYTSLWAMRTGLMTRFWGTLGMALGVALLFLGLPALLAFFLAVSLLVAGIWPGSRPPAWAAGEAVPWPKPGEQPSADAGPSVDPDEPARPEDFEGTAEEVEPGEERANGEKRANGEPATGRPRKRKRREG